MTVPAYDPTKLIEAARTWHDAGFCVIPSHEDGSKRPFGAWKQYQVQRPTWDKLHGWLASGRYTGIGCIMGQASGNAEMIELEGPASVTPLRLDKVVEQARRFADIDLDKLLGSVLHGFTETSAGGGLHTIIRISDGPALGNTKLAHDGDKVIAETRGEGGFVIVYPTTARTGHEPGAAYVLEQGGPASVITVTSEERDLLHLCVQAALDTGEPEPATPPDMPRHAPAGHDSLSPFDDYRARVTWRDILEPAGWTWHSADSEHNYWVRPGKDPRDGHSASTIEDGPFYLFSTSVSGMPTEVGLSKPQVYAHLHHGGDLGAATKALRADGYGGDLVHTDTTLTEFILHAIPSSDPDRERTSWWPRNLTGVIEGHETEPDPTHLTRGDGPAMFYSGRVNGLIGESESGKTWVALHATSQELTQGRRVLYLDFEDSAPGIVNRLRTLGCADTDLAHLTYISPDETLSSTAKQDLAEALIDTSPGLVIVDGFNAAMTLMGLDINSNNDATTFAQQLLKPIAATGACVVYVDHVPKSREARGKGGIGAQAKRAMTTGCALSVTVTEPFGQGQPGRLHLTVDKDRPGKVRAHSYAAKHAGDVVLTPDGKRLKVMIQPSDHGVDTSAQQQSALKEILDLVKASPGMSMSQIEAAATGKSITVRARLDHLVHLGKLQETRQGGAKRYTFIEDLEAMPVFEVVDDD